MKTTIKKLIIALMLLVSIEGFGQTPAIGSFSPASGPVGTLVTITGNNLGSPTIFTIGAVPAIVVSDDGTTLVGMVMPGAMTGSVSVTTSGGSVSGGSNFTVAPTLFPAIQLSSALIGTGATDSAKQGTSVAISGDGSTAILGGPDDNGGTGAAWVYTRSGGVWTQQGAKLVGTGAVGGARQGCAVALSADGNTAVVGGYMDSGAANIYGDTIGSGAVWVYTRTAGVWTQQGPKLVGSGFTIEPTGGNGSSQGSAVSISADGNTLIEGAPEDNDSGAVWIFARSAGSWAEQGGKLVGLFPNGDGGQGYSVSISADGNTAIAGAPYANYPGGASVVFTRSGTTWTQQAVLIGGGEVNQHLQGAEAGYSVALSADGNTAVMGGPDISEYSYDGAVWVFARTGGTWTEVDELLGGNGSYGGSAGLGNTLAISADGYTILAGVLNDNNQSTAWVYTYSGGSWAQRNTLQIGGSEYFTPLSLSADGSTGILGATFYNNSEGEALIYVPCSPLSSSFTQSICQGSTYYLGSQSLSVSGTYIDTMVTINGCDSVVTLTLYVQPDSFMISRGICQGATYSFGGQNLSVSGTYYDSLTSSLGCDSVVILTLTVGTSINTDISQSICTGSFYTFNGQSLTAPGTYSDTFVSVFGCDSIVNLTLIVYPFSYDTSQQEICSGDSFYFGYQYHATSGIYTDTFTSAVGCDSICTLILTVLPVISDTVVQSICFGQSYFGYTSSGMYIDTLTGVLGCDSIRTLHLTVLANNSDTVVQSICSGQSYFGYTLSGTYTDVFIGVNGCDSIRTLNLTVNNCATDTVWPGDADANHIVDNNDLLPIGLAYDSIGPVRAVQGIVWQGDVATDWNDTLPGYSPSVNFKYADCDGNGMVNSADTLAIAANFGLVHAKTNNLPGPWRSGTPGITVQFSQDTVYNNDTVTVGIIAGSSSLPVSDIYGLAFTFNYDPLVVDSNYSMFNFISSPLWSSTNSININRNFNTGQVKAAITGIDHTPRSGYGQIAVFRCIITTDNINGKNYSYYSNLNYISDITAIDQYGNHIPLNAGVDSNEVGFFLSGVKDISQAAKVNVYPNPAADQVRITSTSAMTGIRIIDIVGNEILTISADNKQSETLDISYLAAGVYTVHVSSQTGAATAKLIVSR